MNCAELFLKVKANILKNHAMKAYGRSGGGTPCIIRFCIRWGESVSHTGHSTHSGKALVFH